MIGEQKHIMKLGMSEFRFQNGVPLQPGGGGADPGAQKVPRHNESPTAGEHFEILEPLNGGFSEGKPGN